MQTKVASIHDNSRLVLIEAYTDKEIYADMTSYKSWVLGREPYGFKSLIVILSFNESSRYLTICLEDGTELKKYNPITLIYKPYAEAKNFLTDEGGLLEPKVVE